MAPNLAQDAIADALVEPAEAIERTFVAASSNLTESASLLGRIAGRFAALPAELDSDDLNEATRRILAIAHGGAAMAEALPRESRHLATMHETLEEARTPIWDLRKAMRMLGIVSINARVVIAGIGNGGDEFGNFTHDITEMADRAAQLVKGLVDSHGELLAAIETAERERSGFLERHQRPLATLSADLRAGLDEISARRSSARGNTAETERLSREIHARIAGAVSALQIGDTTRQRVEHIIAALRALAGIVADPMPEDALGEEAGDWHSSARDAVLRLESDQLGAAIADFDTEAGEVRSSLRLLAIESGRAIEKSRALYGSGAQQPASAIARLSGLARDVAAELGECQRERQRVDAVGQHVASVVEVLLQHGEAARQIEFGMRLMSLNAAVKSAQLGPRGRAVTVIAQQLRELTVQIVDATDAAMAILDRTGQAADSFRIAAAANDAEHLGRLERAAAGSVDLLSAADQRLSEALATLAVDGARAVELLSAAARDFASVETTSRQLSSARDALDAIAPAELPAPGDALRRILAGLRKSYSMQSERKVHDALFPPPEADGAGPQPPVLDEAAEVALDVDFF